MDLDRDSELSKDSPVDDIPTDGPPAAQEPKGPFDIGDEIVHVPTGGTGRVAELDPGLLGTPGAWLSLADQPTDVWAPITVIRRADEPRTRRSARPTRVWLKVGVAAAAVAVPAAMGAALWWKAAQAPAPADPASTVAIASTPAVPTTVAAAPTTQAVAIATDSDAERVYLNELAEAGVQLTQEEQGVAIGVAREHVAHGHLIGMRELIRRDFRERIPSLTEEQVEIAKVAVEHHFLAVTGRKQ